MSATLPLRLATVVAAVPKLRLGALAALLLAAFAWAMKRLNTPSRVYDKEANSVGREYDAWTSEGILEYYWGEHIHLGYYAEGERRGPFYGGKDFIEAKYDFIDKMLEFSQVDAPQKVLDVGCGIGGTSRWHPHPRLSATRS
jgi:MPBQ/MSBQ methyltransferase